MLWRLLVLLAGAAFSQRIDRARDYPTTPVTCEDRTRRGCGRVAIVLTGGFSDVTHITPLGKYDAAHAADASNPLLRAWMNITAASLRHHVMRPLAEAYESGVDVSVMSVDGVGALDHHYGIKGVLAPVAPGWVRLPAFRTHVVSIACMHACSIQMHPPKLDLLHNSWSVAHCKPRPRSIVVRGTRV